MSTTNSVTHLPGVTTWPDSTPSIGTNYTYTFPTYATAERVAELEGQVKMLREMVAALIAAKPQVPAKAPTKRARRK